MDPIALVETVYAPAADEAAWVEGTTKAVSAALGGVGGAFGMAYDATDPEWVSYRSLSTSSVDPAFAQVFRAFLDAPPVAAREETLSMVRLFRTVLVTSGRKKMAELSPALRAQFEVVFEGARIADAMVVNATDPSRFGIMFIAPGERRRGWSPRDLHRWQRLAAHVAAAYRLCRLRPHLPGAGSPPIPEAILRPDGRVEHAEGPARDESARAALRRGALARDRARGRLRRKHADAALELWEALLAGRWSLIDQFDSDGRRYVLAHRNDPAAPDVRSLTLRERQVVGYAAAGHPNKVIAYELGLSLSTVAGHLARARTKLSLPSLAALRDFVSVLPGRTEGTSTSPPSRSAAGTSDRSVLSDQ
jgi:DNA-binding CsgD family transcriptional regulator